MMVQYHDQSGKLKDAILPPKPGEPFYFEYNQLNLFPETYKIIEKRDCDQHYCLREYRYPGQPTYSDCLQTFPNLKSAKNYGNTYGIKIRLHPGDRTSKR